jgi:hypothetical protein
VADRIAFADESGTHGNTKCYGIGVVSVAADRLEAFNATFERLKQEHGCAHEIHWGDINRSHGLINLGLQWLDMILRSETVRFDAIIVNTREYRNWSERSPGRERAFYVTYTELLKHMAKQLGQKIRVFIDNRPAAYDKHDEAMEIIANRMLANMESTGTLTDVAKVESVDYPGVQVADMITGAVTSAHRLYLDPTMPLNHGKRLAIARMAGVLGWDHLHYDTLPDSSFNIWHFPVEYRAKPATLKVERRAPVFVTPSDWP